MGYVTQKILYYYDFTIKLVKNVLRYLNIYVVPSGCFATEVIIGQEYT